MPYNYVLDKRLLKSLAIKLQDFIVIFDEARNIKKVCQEAVSSRITSTDITASLVEIEQLMDLMKVSVTYTPHVATYRRRLRLH